MECSCVSRPEPYHVFTRYVQWGWSLQGTSLGVYVDLSDPAGVYENVRQVIFPCSRKPNLNCVLVGKSEHNWVVSTKQPWVQYQVEKWFFINYHNNISILSSDWVFWIQATAFGLKSVVGVPGLEMDTVAALSSFCEKASTVSNGEG